MEIKELITRLVKERKMTKVAVAGKLGWKSQDLNDKLFRYKNVSVENLKAVLDALGYDLVVKDRISGKEVEVLR